MFDSFRAWLSKSPWAGWLVALIMLGCAITIYMRTRTSTDPYSTDRMTETVTIKFTDTGEVVKMPRGRMEVQLRDRVGLVDPTQGIQNPSTQQFTGVLVNQEDWEDTVKRINLEKEAAMAKRGVPLSPPSASAATKDSK